MKERLFIAAVLVAFLLPAALAAPSLAKTTYTYVEYKPCATGYAYRELVTDDATGRLISSTVTCAGYVA